jgi:hypothetical protein
VIPAENGKEIKIQLGKGVEWSSDGLHVIATMDGRPELSAGKISIQPIYAVNGDLTLETGSIHFNGDVLISGDVQEGLSIEATGSVEVRGSVTQAKIIAGKNIIVAKNVISSHLTAGGLGSVYQQLLDRINRVINHLNILISGYQQLHMLPAFNKEKFDGGPGQVIKLIIESKLHNFNDVLKHLEDAYAQSGLEEDQLEHWLKQVKQKLTGLGLFSIKSLEEVEQLVQTGSELKRAWEDYQDEECLIQVGYIHNSTVRAHGSIYVKGSGVYNSKLYADQSIYVMGRPGVVRGGYLEAGQMVQVRELGVSSGVKAHILIRNEHGRILADHLYPGITMTINGINYDQEKYSRNVQVYYDGEIHSIRVGGLI